MVPMSPDLGKDLLSPIGYLSSGEPCYGPTTTLYFERMHIHTVISSSSATETLPFFVAATALMTNTL